MKNSLSEKIRIARTVQDLIDFRNKIIYVSKFELKKTSFHSQSEWLIRNGIICHQTKGFFYVTGLKRFYSEEEYLVLYQPQGALNGLAICKYEGTAFVLVQARIEPGNDGICQYGPTVQSTPANYLKLHGGQNTPYLDLFYNYPNSSDLISLNTQVDIGKRYFQKIKNLVFVGTDELLPCAESMIWAPVKVLFQCTPLDNFLNTDLRSQLAVFDWDAFLEGDATTKSKLTENFFNEYFRQKSFMKPTFRLVPIDGLTNWVQTDNGVECLHEYGISLGFYNIKSNTREVVSWTQPLIQGKKPGVVQLLTRLGISEREYLITIKQEIGIDGGIVVGPSNWVYTDEEENPDILNYGETIYRFNQSDEGGRFINHSSIFRLAQVDMDFVNEPNQYWISALTLKKLLAMSNTVNIQLRCICSCILNHLNEYSF